MAKFKILATGHIAGLKKRFKAGYYETQDVNEISVLSSNKSAAMVIKEPVVVEVTKPVEEIKIKKEVNPVGKHNHKTR